jgi:hypothetical protein
VNSVAATQASPSNGCVYTESFPSNGFLCWLHNSGFQQTAHFAPSLRLFVQEVYRHTAISYFPRGRACDMCIDPGGWHFDALLEAAILPVFAAFNLLSPLLISQGDYSPNAPAAPSLRPLVPRGSLISCEQVQVYQLHHRSKVHLDSVHHIVCRCDFPVWVIAGGLKLR